MDVELRGWGPDYSEIDAICMMPDCRWESRWSDAVSLDEINRKVQEHMASAHPETVVPER